MGVFFLSLSERLILVFVKEWGLILKGFLESKKCDRRKNKKLKALIKKSFDLGFDFW